MLEHLKGNQQMYNMYHPRDYFKRLWAWSRRPDPFRGPPLKSQGIVQ